MVLLAMSTDQLTVGGAIGNTFRNAPYVVEQYYSIFCFITLLEPFVVIYRELILAKGNARRSCACKSLWNPGNRSQAFEL